MALRAQPVVGMDRSRKARMINAILADFRHCPVAGLRILDIGVGNGDISRFFPATTK